MLNSYIKGVGFCVPENIVYNQDLESKMETNNKWIVERTGIEQRRHVIPGEQSTHDLAHQAALNALENAELSSKDIDFIVFATLSPDYYFPGNGVLLQKSLGCNTIGALDIRNQCSGFIYALSVADQFIKTGTYKNILVVGAEIHSFGLDMTTRGRGVSVLFGDGAGATILSATDNPNKGIINFNMHSEGSYAEDLAVLFPGSKHGWSDTILKENNNITEEHIFPKMNGNYVFKQAIQRFPETILESLSKANLTPKDLDLLIPHQANLRIAQYVQQTLELKDNQVFNNVQKYGNTTAASIPIALSEAVLQNKIKERDLVCLAAFGSGFTWGSVLLRW